MAIANGSLDLHNKLHGDKRAAAVETVTTVYYQTVVWVNGNGEVVSTEINTPPPGAATATVEKSKPSVTVADQGASRKPMWRPNRPSSSPVSAFPPFNSPAGPPAPASSSDTPAPPQPSTDVVKPDTQTAVANTAETQSNAAVPGGMGVCFDMQDISCKDSSTINSNFAFLKSQGYSMVRVYDIGCDVGAYVSAASSHGLKLMIGINSIANMDNDLNKLIGMVNGNWDPVDTVYICNECVNSGAFSASQVAGAVTTAKQTLQGKGFSGSVVTVDTFNKMMVDPTICSTSDYCATNIHAFFDPNTTADKAGSFVSNMLQKVISANGGKRTVVTESGWPYSGQCNGQACPSPQNQQTAISSIQSAFSGSANSIYLFQAYDASYKQPGAFGVEPYFGIYDH